MSNFVYYLAIMTKKTDSDKTWRRKPVWEGSWRFALSLLLLFLIVRFMIYPERAKIKEYREELSIDHQVARGYIDRIVHKDNTIYYVFTVDGVEYSGVSRYSLSDKPYPQKGDSIDVYYSEADPHVNLWRGEFPK